MVAIPVVLTAAVALLPARARPLTSSVISASASIGTASYSCTARMRCLNSTGGIGG